MTIHFPCCGLCSRCARPACLDDNTARTCEQCAQLLCGDCETCPDCPEETP